VTGRARCPVCSLYHRNGYPSTCVPDRRWPLAPLLAVMTAEQRTNVPVTLGISGGMMSMAEGEGLPDPTADRVAIRLGLHPGEIWSDWFDAGLTEHDRTFVAEGWRQAWEWNEAHQPETEEAAA
jgi:hypothetical protein